MDTHYWRWTDAFLLGHNTTLVYLLTTIQSLYIYIYIFLTRLRFSEIVSYIFTFYHSAYETIRVRRLLPDTCLTFYFSLPVHYYSFVIDIRVYGYLVDILIYAIPHGRGIFIYFEPLQSKPHDRRTRFVREMTLLDLYGTIAQLLTFLLHVTLT